MNDRSNLSISIWKAWIISARPKTLVAAGGPLLISSAYLWEKLSYFQSPNFPWGRVVLVWIACFILQIACNLTNDYFDYTRGADNDERIGPKRMLQQGIITKEVLSKGIFTLYLGFFLITMILSFTLTWWIMALSFISMSAAYFYTGGRYPLSYYGLGDFFAFWFFGPLLTWIIIFTAGYSLVPFDGVTAFILGLAPGFFSLTLININNIRDLEQDRKVGKFTAAQLWGDRLSRYLLAVFFSLSTIIPFLVGTYYKKDNAPVLLIFLAQAAVFFPMALRIRGVELNRLIGFTAGCYVIETIVFSWVWLN